MTQHRTPRLLFGLSLAALLTLVCSAPGVVTPPPTIVPPPTTVPTSAPTVPPTPRTTSTPAPSPTPYPVLAVVGEPEVVFDWTSDRCDEEDIPDLPARAFRDAQGRVNLISTHYVGRRFLGPDLDHVTRDCQVVMRFDGNPDPASFDDRQWLAAPYTEDGQTIYSLVHNEYQGHTHASQCASGEYFPCWYNAITLAVSTDGGASYDEAASPPGHLVAALPVQYEDGAGPYGVFEPGNIVRRDDGYYYAFVRIDEFRSEAQYICPMRTPDLADPAAWRAWDGSGFTYRFINPYLEASGPDAPRCHALPPDQMGVMNQSLTYNTYLNRWLMVGATAIHLEGREVWGVLYALSDDLIHWDDRRLLFEAQLSALWQPGDDEPIGYPSLLDPASPSRNFETSGRTAYVYYTHFNTSGGESFNDRDLVRVPVAFQ